MINKTDELRKEALKKAKRDADFTVGVYTRVDGLDLYLAQAIRADDEANGMVLVNRRLVELMSMACASVENQANWDKRPYSLWYYEAKKLLAAWEKEHE